MLHGPNKESAQKIPHTHIKMMALNSDCGFCTGIVTHSKHTTSFNKEKSNPKRNKTKQKMRAKNGTLQTFSGIIHGSSVMGVGRGGW